MESPPRQQGDERGDGRRTKAVIRKPTIAICQAPAGGRFLRKVFVTAGKTRVVAITSAELVGAAEAQSRIRVNFTTPASCHGGRRFDDVAASIELAELIGSTLPMVQSSETVDVPNDGSDNEGKRPNWTVLLSIVLLESDGNVFDWSLLAATLALKDLKFPVVTWDGAAQWWALAAEKGSGDTVRYTSPLPVSITAVLRPDGELLFDPTAKEEALGSYISAVFQGRGLPMLLKRGHGPMLDKRAMQSFVEAAEKYIELN